MIARLLLALVVFVAAGLILAALLPPLLATLFAGIPVAAVIAGFFERWGWVIAACIAVWFFFSGWAPAGGWPWAGRP